MKTKTNPILSPTELFVPPQATELEEAILGAIIQEGRAAEKAMELLMDDDFYNPVYQTIFKAIASLNKRKRLVDMYSVSEELKQMGEFENIGGLYAITNLTAQISSSAYLEHHCLVVKQKAVERRVIESAQNAIRKIQSSEDIDDVMFDLSKDIESLQEALAGKNDTLHIYIPIKEAINDMHRRKQLAESGKSTGINTGITDLNKKTNGWQKSELIVIAARPAMGKTALCLHFAKSAAKEDTPVAMFSLEMSSISLANRLLLSECDVDADKFKSGYLSKEDTNAIEKAAYAIHELPIYVDDNPSVSMSYIRSKCRLLKKQGKCEMVIIDYLQLASESKEKNRNREQEISQMSREAKIIAKELDIPVILLSQLNRSVEARADKKPLLSDLRESGAIEQDADMVIFIHRPGYYGIEVQNSTGDAENNYGELIIAKNRNGATGLSKFKHNDSMTKIYDYSHFKTPF